MRIAFYDGIVETHVASSLERALTTSGHSVFNTGKIGHGFTFATEKTKLQTLKRALDQVLEFEPDVIFVFRPASLPSSLLRRARSTGARLVVWLSDDPVLWDLTYGPVLDSYDIVLHCGTARVLKFYEDMFGRPTGVNFPFWTDAEAFPYVFGTERRETDAIFLGNVHDEVRRQRYFDLGALESSLRIHGAVGKDYFNIWGGFLDSDKEVAQAGARAGVAVNIPQYFRDHRGLETWFPGLDELGFFQYPSRVIQYAAMGLPIISVVPSPQDLESFPEITTVSGMRELDHAIQATVSASNLEALSLSTNERFQRHYSAASRVLALESILVDDSWRSLDAGERAMWFTQFDALKGPFTDPRAASRVAGLSSGATIEVSSPVRAPLDVSSPVQAPTDVSSPVQAPTDVSSPVQAPTDVSSPVQARTDVSSPVQAPMDVLVVGTALGRVTSGSSVAIRALIELGHRVGVRDAATCSFLVPDPNHEFKFVVDAKKLLADHGTAPNVLLISSIDCGITESASRKLHELGVQICVIGSTIKSVDTRAKRLIGRVDLLGLLNSDVAREARGSGHINVIHLPPLIDQEFVRCMERVGPRRSATAVVAKRKIHFENQAPAFQDVSGWPSERIYIEQEHEALRSLEALAEELNVSLILAPHDASEPGPLPSEIAPFALAAGALVVVPRGTGPMHLTQPGTASLSVREKGELGRKLARLATTEGPGVEAYLDEARRKVAEELSAEVRLSQIIKSKPESVGPSQPIAAGPIPRDSTESTWVHIGQSLTVEIVGKSKARALLQLELESTCSAAGGDRVTVMVEDIQHQIAYCDVLSANQSITQIEFVYPQAPSAVNLKISLGVLADSTKNQPASRAGSRIRSFQWSHSPEEVRQLEVRSDSHSARVRRASTRNGS